MVQIYHVNAMDMLHRDIGLFDAVITDPPYSSGGATLTDKQRGTAQKYTNTKQHCPFPDFVGDAMDQRSWTRREAEGRLRPSAWPMACTRDGPQGLGRAKRDDAGGVVRRP